MADEMTSSGAASSGFVYTAAFDAAKKMWDERVAAYVASARRQVVEHREREGLAPDALISVKVDATMRTYVVAAFADDPTVIVADPAGSTTEESEDGSRG